MMKTPLLTLAAVLIFPIFSHADFSNNKCSEVLQSNGVIQVNRQWNESSGTCFIALTPRQIVDLKYRDYYFDNSGHFMVFNSYGYGSDSETTGARVFYFFPLIEDYPDYSFEENGDVVIKLVSGQLFRVSGKDFSIVSLSDAAIKEMPLSKKNAGGVEIKLTKGFWLDAGFKMGGTGLDKPAKKSVFRSAAAKQQSCQVANREFLNYTSSGDFSMKYTGDIMKQFVKSKCPQLKL